MSNDQSEDTMIFYALTTTKLAPVYDALSRFFNKKRSTYISDRFNLICFLKNGPNYLEDFTLNSDHILAALHSLEPHIVKADVGKGIIVSFATFLNVYKKISEKHFRLIILTDYGTIKISERYFNIIKNFMEKVKNVKFTLDLIKIQGHIKSEDLHLNEIIWKCGGRILRIDDLRKLPVIMENLADKQEDFTTNSLNGNFVEIKEESYSFYEDLADEMLYYKEEGTCSICFEKNKQNMVQCPSCETLTHIACLVHWAKTTNIGIQHVFRCHNCYNLVKLNKESLKQIQQEKLSTREEIIITEKDMEKYLESSENSDDPKIISIEDIKIVPKDKEDRNFESLY